MPGTHGNFGRISFEGDFFAFLSVAVTRCVTRPVKLLVVPGRPDLPFPQSRKLAQLHSQPYTHGSMIDFPFCEALG